MGDTVDVISLFMCGTMDMGRREDLGLEWQTERGRRDRRRRGGARVGRREREGANSLFRPFLLTRHIKARNQSCKLVCSWTRLPNDGGMERMKWRRHGIWDREGICESCNQRLWGGRWRGGGWGCPAVDVLPNAGALCVYVCLSVCVSSRPTATSLNYEGGEGSSWLLFVTGKP